MLLTPFYKLTLKMVGLIVAIVIACRLTQDYAMVLITMVGVFYSLSNQRGKALVIYLIFPFLGFFNPLILPHTPAFAMFSRLGTLAMTGALLIASVRSPGKERIPLGGLYFFMIVAVISSLQGWFPMISFLKLANFLVFISGIYIGTRNLHHRPHDIVLLRATFMALSFILVFGSVATLPFPAISYITSLKYYIQEGGIAYAEALFESNESAQIALFAGITNHSQFLAPALVCINVWVLCDMLLIEKKIEKAHLALLGVCPLLIFMTRSRIGFFGYAASLAFVYTFTLPKSALSGRARARLSGWMFALLILLIVWAVTFEVREQTISRWLRKTEEVQTDQRSLKEALTDSRQGTIELCMSEFRRSPLLGSGFQVLEVHRAQYERGEISLFSAPLEKGILPLMVLGETGILGATVFGIFLVAFVLGCLKSKYIATLTLFSCLLMTNMGEATFFSPSGGGGVLWMLTAVGGFLIDMSNVVERRMGTARAGLRAQFGFTGAR
ncbi:MAG: O-antigen ligase family protein [Kiritimatiellae bacterium]|nr:O-antigen ligase family protein [Kiritimatiellia bacterium]